MKRFPWMLTVLTTAAIALLIGLGVWQVQRLRWKEGLIAKAEAASTRPPEPLDAVLAGGDVEFRKALMVCPGLATAPYVELQSIHDGQPGVRLISACRPAGRQDVLLVDRGFVADGQGGGRASWPRPCRWCWWANCASRRRRPPWRHRPPTTASTRATTRRWRRRWA